MNTVAVLGGGNGAHAAAADLTLKGFRVFLFSRSPETFKPLRDQGGIFLIDPSGERLVPIYRVCENIEEALSEAELILVTVPAIGHEYYAHACAPLLKDGQVVVLNPGSTGGALAFKKILREKGTKSDVPICETNTLTYICRLIGPAKVRVTVPLKVQFAALPGKETGDYVEMFKELFPDTTERKNALETSLTNLNAVMHPPGMIMNAGWIEHTKGDFSYYCEGGTPAIARVIEELDRERISLCHKINYPTERLLDFFYKAGATSERAYRSGSFYQALQESEPNRFIRAPETLSHRYIAEDIPFGIVPMAYLGEMLGVPTPTINALIGLASLINDTDYRQTGWTLEKMGIEGMTLEELLNYVENG
jgi:opine dehydrogenase